MTEARDILWFDNDPLFTKAGYQALTDAGMVVDQAITLTEAETLLEANEYKMMILDVMIPVDEDEAKDYPQDQTENGAKTGLLFYSKFKDKLKAKNMPVLVMTSRLDVRTFLQFNKEDLQREHYATKFALRKPQLLVEKVQQIQKLNP